MTKPSVSSINMEPASSPEFGMTSDGRRKSAIGSVLSAHNINYKVIVPTGCCGGRKIEKTILNDVTAVFKPGMTAIMGPTGSGKSTFLDILANRKEKSGVSGNLLLDGKRLPSNFKCMVGYVVQDDKVMGTLSIRENIQFSAALRLPASMSSAEREEKVNAVIKELCLDKCADTKVGTEFIRGVSGGERKRCTIGMELIISPRVLFLDEPTTGLDSDTAYTVLRILKRLSTRGRTIIFSIHQPRYSIFCLFDSLLLVAGGSLVFNGPCYEALDFFSTQGYSCEVHNNPPDFFMDVINDHQKLTRDGVETGTTEEPTENHVSQESKLITGFRQSHWNRRLQEEAAAIFCQFETQDLNGSENDNLCYSTSHVRQIRWVAARALTNISRDPHIMFLTFGTSIVFSVLITAIFWQVNENSKTAFKDRSGVMFFIIISQLFYNFAAVDIFIKERILFMHEHISGYYRVSVYFFVKIAFDLIPMRTIPIMIISSIIYFSVGLNPGLEHFLMFMLCLLSITLAGAGVCFFVCSTVREFPVANVLLALLYILMMLLGGFLVSFDSIGSWLNWGQYLSIFRYGLAALYINEFKGRIFCDTNRTVCETGDDYLRMQQVQFEQPWDMWMNHVALLSFTVGMLMLTYIRLLMMKKTM